MISLIIFIAALISAIVAFISATDKIYDNRHKGLSGITKRGWLYVVFSAILVALPPLQNYIQDIQTTADQNIRDSAMRASYDSSILKMKHNYDSSNKVTVEVLADILGKYGYTLDSTNKRLVKLIKDSAKTKVFMPDNPVVYISSFKFLGHVEDYNKYEIIIQSADAGSCDYKIKLSVVTTDTATSHMFYLHSLKPISTESMFKEQSMNFEFKIHQNNDPIVAIWFRGTYKNVDKSKTFSVNNVYYNNMDEILLPNQVGSVNGETRDRIIKFIKANEK